MTQTTMLIGYGACTAVTWAFFGAENAYLKEMKSKDYQNSSMEWKVLGGFIWPVVVAFIIGDNIGKLVALPGIALAKRHKRLKAEAIENKRIAALPLEKLIKEAETRD